MDHLPEELRAQLAEQSKQCLFCRIISGEVDARKVYEDELLLAILDVNPACKGHTLLVPKEHYPILPFLAPETFAHLFGVLPRISKAVMEGSVRTGMTVFIASGGAAGQRSPHLVVHLIPREAGDGLTSLHVPAGDARGDADRDNLVRVLSQNLPLMLARHAQRHPDLVPGGPGAASGGAIYEDDVISCALADSPAGRGHLVIRPREGFFDLGFDEAAHLFFVASFAATALFESLGAQGTNIVCNAGAFDGSDGAVHVLARFEGDGLDFLWEPGRAEGLDAMASKIRDKSVFVEHAVRSGEHRRKRVVRSAEDEIRDAISAVISGRG